MLLTAPGRPPSAELGEDGRAVLSSVPDRSPVWMAIAQWYVRAQGWGRPLHGLPPRWERESLPSGLCLGTDF